jgi:hypothetical protein
LLNLIIIFSLFTLLGFLVRWNNYDAGFKYQLFIVWIWCFIWGLIFYWRYLGRCLQIMSPVLKWLWLTLCLSNVFFLDLFFLFSSLILHLIWIFNVLDIFIIVGCFISIWCMLFSCCYNFFVIFCSIETWICAKWTILDWSVWETRIKVACLLSLISFLKIRKINFHFCRNLFLAYLLCKMRRLLILVTIKILIFLRKIKVIFIPNVFAAASFDWLLWL